MSGCDGIGPCACGCCEGPAEGALPTNRPGLPALAYRVGTHPTFLARMLRRLSTLPVGEGADAPAPLRALTTRQPDDPAIALLDAWAVAADVVTFYQERIANEGFLRTATERRSVRELARAIGYELKPGVAATAYLAFTVETAGSSPPHATVPAGTKVQSIPVEKALPQVFETEGEMVAQGAWNELRPRLTWPQVLDPDVSEVWLAGRRDIRPGAWVCYVTKTGDKATAAPRRVLAVAHDDVRGRTQLKLAAAKKPPPFIPILTVGLPKVQKLVLNRERIGEIRAQRWSERDLGAMVSLQRWNRQHLAAAMRFLRPKSTVPEEQADANAIPEGIYAFPLRTAPFGSNAPRWDSLAVSARYDSSKTGGAPTGTTVAYLMTWDGDANEPTIAEQSQPKAPAATGARYTYPESHAVDFFAERTHPEVVEGSLLLLESTTAKEEDAPTAFRVKSVKEASLADYSLSSRCTGFDVERIGEGKKVGGVETGGVESFKVRKTIIHSTILHAGDARLELAAMPIETEVGAGTAEDDQVELDVLALGLAVGQPVAVHGDRADLPGVAGAEIAILRDVVHQEGLTTLYFEAPLRFRYLRESVRINANVVKATHGETTREVLGSGNGALANQAFVPRKSPVTYVAAPTATGTEGTMEVRVDGVLWEEAPALYGLDPAAEAYTVRLQEDGRARVVFGDGEMGARLPTGAENVHATYRFGIGTPGMVGASSISLMQTRPLGIREVTNPVEASGAEDPEDRDGARANAPRTVLTMDRIVSLRDYEDFAAGFAGVGKAQSVAIPRGEHALVHLTIADVYGEEVPEDAPLRTTLREAVMSLRDPGPPFQLDSFDRLYFNLKATIRADPRRVQADVLAAAAAAVLDAFSFARRGFGQPVTAAEVVTVLQGTTGVVAVDLDELFLVDDPDTAPASGGLNAVLAVAKARAGSAGEILPAQLLLVNPVGVSLAPAKKEAV